MIEDCIELRGPKSNGAGGGSQKARTGEAPKPRPSCSVHKKDYLYCGDPFSAITMVAHFFYEQCWPLPSELTPGSTGGEEGYLGLQPQLFLCGAQIALFSLLRPFSIFHLSDSQFFFYGGKLRPPRFR